MLIEDPLSGFIYPENWLSNCSDPDILSGLKKGLFILTSSGKVLRRGLSTGTTAAAACKAAILSLTRTVEFVEVTTASGIKVTLPVTCSNGTCDAIKYSGDYKTDITSGLIIRAKAIEEPKKVILKTGTGIGIHSRKTARYSPGEPSISPKALACIYQAMNEAIVMTKKTGTTVTLCIPEGEKIAGLTLNPSLGITGGISVLGTTGFVEPWDEHLTASTLDRVRLLESPVITTGRTGLTYAHMLFPEREVILIGNKIKQALDTAKGNPILIGLPALILKFFNPDILKGTDALSVEELMNTPFWDERLYESLGYARDKYPELSIIILDRDGNILARRP